MIGTLTSSSPFSSTNFIPAGIFPRKTFHLRFYSLHSRILNPTPWPLRSSPIILCSHQVNIEAAEMEGREKSTIKTVRVRFQLRKECVFGQQFFIVGDDPVFGGLWDPEYALPLNWSDGHVWTVDLDLPVGRLVEFKFILKAKTGEILWQPGPNRALETRETNKSIRVCQDWDNADLQMMIDDDFVPLNQQVKRPEQSVRLITTHVSSNGGKEEEQVLGTVQQKSSEAVVVDVGYIRSDDSDENLSSNRQSEKNMETTSNGALTARLLQEENVTKNVLEAPVLVPGLIPLSDLENELVNEAINEGKAETFPEVGKKEETKTERKEKGKIKAISLFEKSEAIKGVEKMQHNASEEEMQQQQQQRLETDSFGTPNVLLEKDIQWGRRTLYKLLSNFGLF